MLKIFAGSVCPGTKLEHVRSVGDLFFYTKVIFIQEYAPAKLSNFINLFYK